MFLRSRLTSRPSLLATGRDRMVRYARDGIPSHSCTWIRWWLVNTLYATVFGSWGIVHYGHRALWTAEIFDRVGYLILLQSVGLALMACPGFLSVAVSGSAFVKTAGTGL